jgi:hypothetical protein
MFYGFMLRQIHEIQLESGGCGWRRRKEQPLHDVAHGEDVATGETSCSAEGRLQPLGAKAVAGGAARAMDRFGHRALLAFRAG